MIRTLIVIAVASFVLTLACFAGVAAIGGRELAANGWIWPEKWESYGIHISDNHIDVTPGETRDIPWRGGDTLDLDIAADVEFAQGSPARVTIEGPRRLIDQVVVRDGRLMYDDQGRGYVDATGPELKVTITAPGVRKFVVNGSGDVRVEGYEQENLTVEINGSGNFAVSGRTDRLAATVSGSGAADLEDLQVGDANVKVVGSGDVTAGPTGVVEVAIAGSGDVRLTRKVARLTSQIDGSGDVHTAD